MKKFLPLLPLVASLLARPAAAQTLTNDGATLVVRPGTLLFVAGSVLNQAGSTLTIDGTVQLTGNFTSAAAPAGLGGSGLLRFSGAQDQTLDAPAGTALASLTLNNSGPVGNNRLLVPNDLTLGGVLTLDAGLVRTAAKAVLTLPDGATLAGEGPGRYVQGHLRVIRNAVPGLVDFGHGVRLDGTGQALGAVSVTRTAGLATAGVSHGTNLGATTKGIDRIWTVVPAAQPGSPLPISLSWLADDDNGLVGFAQARVWQAATAAGPWAAAGAPVNAAARTLTQNVATLGTFTISNAANPLPVELTQFTAEPRGADAVLRWATASEKNNDRFEVEASADGRRFERVATVAGQGNSAHLHTYQLTDKNIARYATGLVYYRLRQVDADGTAAHSPVRTVRAPLEATLAVTAWPNPFAAAGLTLSLRTAVGGPATVVLLDALGRVQLTRAFDLLPGATALPLPELGRLGTGVYFLSVRQAGQQARLKVVRE